MKINKLASAIIIFIITLVLIFLFIMPKYGTLDELQNTLYQKQAEYDSKFAYYTKISQIVKDIESKKDGLEKINSALPSDLSLAQPVYFFQKKGTEAGLAIKSITLSQISTATPDQDIRDITFNIHVTGTYESFKNFLSSLDKSARLFEVNSISFSAPVASSKLPKAAQAYEFNMEVIAHTY